MFEMGSYQCSPSHSVHHFSHLRGSAYIHVLMDLTEHLNLTVGAGEPVSVVSVYRIITIRAVLGHMLSR